jgi:hypothetical protein
VCKVNAAVNYLGFQNPAEPMRVQGQSPKFNTRVKFEAIFVEPVRERIASNDGSSKSDTRVRYLSNSALSSFEIASNALRSDISAKWDTRVPFEAIFVEPVRVGQ